MASLPAHPEPDRLEPRALAFAGVAGQLELLRTGATTAAELTEVTLERADRAQATLNPFRVLRPDAARDEAAAADRLRERGGRLPLLGVPVAIKDDCDLAGETTMFGCTGDFRPCRADSEVVRRLRGAGAVVVGKTTTPELGQWPFTEGQAFGATRNPWNPDFTPGGSSGGSAVAVATGVVPAALGSDGAGSIRIPAAWTHLVGIKPERGRTSSWPDAEAFEGLTCTGTLARSVGDAALLLDAITGNHPGDRHRPAPRDETLAHAVRRAPGPLRVAVSTRLPFTAVRAHLDREIAAAVARLADQLSGLGHHVEEADPDYGLVGLDFLARSLPAISEWAGRLPAGCTIDPRTAANAVTGHRLRPLVPAARRHERRAAARVGAIFDRFDVVLAPTTALPPSRVGAADGLSGWQTDELIVRHCPYAWPWNVLGWPAVNVPAGFTRGGLPIGAQLLGPAASEARLVSLAAELEDAEGWADHHPPGW